MTRNKTPIAVITEGYGHELRVFAGSKPGVELDLVKDSGRVIKFDIKDNAAFNRSLGLEGGSGGTAELPEETKKLIETIAENNKIVENPTKEVMSFNNSANISSSNNAAYQWFTPKSNELYTGKIIKEVKANFSTPGQFTVAVTSFNGTAFTVVKKVTKEVTTGINTFEINHKMEASQYISLKDVNETAQFIFGGGTPDERGFFYNNGTTIVRDNNNGLNVAIVVEDDSPAAKITPVKEKIRKKFFAGKLMKRPDLFPNNANTVGIFTNATNFQYAGKKVTSVGFITSQPGLINLKIVKPGTPLVVVKDIPLTLVEGDGAQWYPVDIDVPEGHWLAVKCETGLFKYSSHTTTGIAGNGFLTITSGMLPVPDRGTSGSCLGFGIEVEMDKPDIITPYTGKLFGVVGDSISTYEGYTNPGNALYYNAERQRSFNIPTVNDTWWMRVINGVGGILNGNDAISGSRVSGEGAGLAHLRSNRFDANTDVLLVMIGINDLSGNVALGEQVNPVGHAHNKAEITGAYQLFIETAQQVNPSMEIVIITNLSRWINNEENRNGNGLTPRLLQARIKEIANLYGLKCIDLGSGIGHNKFNNSALFPDNTHPNYYGMERMARHIISELV